MSVPLDRLYHYLADVVNQDVLIYRWMPHGSRKLKDLEILTPASYAEMHLNPAMVCHDQEPLHFDAWTQEEFEQHILLTFRNNNCEILAQDSVAKHHAKFHLRCAINQTIANLYDTTLLLHSEKNSTEVQRYQHAGFVPVYYWSHAVIARDWFRYAEHDSKLANKTVQQDFLIYNRAWSGTREYRLYFTEQIVEHELNLHCKMSFNAYDNDTHYSQHQFVNSALQITNFNLEDFFPANTHTATASADYVSEDYQSTGIEVVLETIFDDTRWHLTEKILRPIACAQPFILCSTPGSLRYIREYGFETFDGLIDESYDAVVDNKQRLHCIINEMKRIANLPNADRQQLYYKLTQISQRNQARFFSKEFQNYVFTELKHNLEQGMTIMKQHCTGSTIIECQALYETIPGYRNWKHHNGIRSTAEYQYLLEQLEKCTT